MLHTKSIIIENIYMIQMSQKQQNQINFDKLNKLAPILMSKKNISSSQVQKSKTGKKEVNEEVLAHFEIKPAQVQSSSKRRRLKKLCEVNQSEQILRMSSDQDDKTEKLAQQEDKYQQFGLKDDQDLKKEKQAQDAAKNHKALKGNQKLDSFIENLKKNPEKQKKQNKNKIPANQLTIEETMRIKKEKKKNRKSSDEFIVSDHADISEVDDNYIHARTLAAYEKYNGSMDDEKQLIEKAMKLSLTATSNKKQENDGIESFAYEHNLDKKPQALFKPNKSEVKQQQIKKQKSKPKNVPKQVKTGPFVGLVIAFTGDFQLYSKDELIQVCSQLGSETPKSFTKKTNLLIQGAFVLDHYKRRSTQPINETNKSKQAFKNGVRILPYEQIDDFFIEKTGYNVLHHIDKNKVKINPITTYINKQINLKQNNQQKQQKRPNQDYMYSKQYTQTLSSFKSDINQKMDIQPPKKPINDYRLWTEKHKPTTLEEVIGENSQIKSLREWLESWEDIHYRGNKRDVKDAKGWNAAGSINSKAALLSGDPGIGKTTTARLLAVQLKYAVSEFNASDIRNKSGVNLMQTGSYNFNSKKQMNRSLIIMDEVDGMSSGDRGGVAAIINMIKNSKIPIICICNDRSSDKIRSLAGHCLDIKFHKPHKGMMVKRIKEILISEGGSGQDRALEQLVQTFQNDMRQILSYLQVIFKTVSKRITIDALSERSKHSKDSSVMINHFDATRRLLNRTQFSRMTLQQRNQCFFVDSDLVPLMVHQNILSSARKTRLNVKQFHSLVQGLQGMVIGDVLDRTIRKEQQWGLMPSFGFMTCVYPTEKISQSIGYPAFPSWLGKFSSQRKVKRLAKEFKDFLFPITLCSSWKQVKSNYVPIVIQQLIELLKTQDIQQAVMMMQNYNITPAVITDHLPSLNFSTEKANPFANIPSAIKSKLTRIFNKRHEDAKLKQQNSKGNKPKVDHLKFDPVLQVENSVQEQEEPQQQSKQQIVNIKAVSKGKAKKK